MLLLATVLSVLVAGATQRITGIGFALVSAPLLVLTNGPTTGVLLANLLSLITNLSVLAATWRQVDLKKVLLLAGPALCLIPVGELVARQMPPRVLMVGIGGLVLAALAAVRLLRRAGLFAGVRGAVLAGALSGFMNVTAGVGGPAVTLYAIANRWPQKSFVGSMQLYFACLNTGSILVKGLPHVPPLLLGAVLGALALGLLLGQIAASHVPTEVTRNAVLWLAVAGAAGTVLKGLGVF
jgi:hypothetical protein